MTAIGSIFSGVASGALGEAAPVVGVGSGALDGTNRASTGFARRDEVALSPQAKEALRGSGGKAGLANGEGEGGNSLELTDAEQVQVRELAARDREVRAHEQAHAAVGGQYAGAPSYEYQQGPDGKRYAVGGEVSIDTSPVSGDPEATIEKMEVVKRAALAPAEPSSQDRKVAQAADQQIQSSRAELQALRAAQARGEVDEDGNPVQQADDGEALNSAGVQGADGAQVGGDFPTAGGGFATASPQMQRALGAYAQVAGLA